MTRYHFDNQIQKKSFSRNKVAGTSFAILGIVAIIIFVIAPVIRNIARGPQWLHTETKEVIGDIATSLTPKKAVLRQNAELKAEAESYKAQLLELQTLRDENEKLRTELSYITNPGEVNTLFVHLFARIRLGALRAGQKEYLLCVLSCDFPGIIRSSRIDADHHLIGHPAEGA